MPAGPSRLGYCHSWPCREGHTPPKHFPLPKKIYKRKAPPSAGRASSNGGLPNTSKEQLKALEGHLSAAFGGREVLIQTPIQRLNLVTKGSKGLCLRLLFYPISIHLQPSRNDPSSPTWYSFREALHKRDSAIQNNSTVSYIYNYT